MGTSPTAAVGPLALAGRAELGGRGRRLLGHSQLHCALRECRRTSLGLRTQARVVLRVRSRTSHLKANTPFGAFLERFTTRLACAPAGADGDGPPALGLADPARRRRDGKWRHHQMSSPEAGSAEENEVPCGHREQGSTAHLGPKRWSALRAQYAHTRPSVRGADGQLVHSARASLPTVPAHSTAMNHPDWLGRSPSPVPRDHASARRGGP